MRIIVWTKEAKDDLANIVSFYNHRNGSTKYSKKLVNAFKSILFLLKNNPFLGMSVENKQNYRVLIIKEFKIFYKVLPNNIEIRLIWDSRQKPDDIPDR